MLAGTDSANSASMKEAIENDVAQVESIDDDIPSFCRRHCTIRHEVGGSEREKEAAEDSKSEAELVDVADTLKRAGQLTGACRSTDRLAQKPNQTTSPFHFV